MPSTRRLVDVIVLGGQVGPLAAACLLSRRGHKVLHIEHDGLEGGYSDAGLQLPLSPEILPGPKSSPAIASVLETLALTTDASRAFRRLTSHVQVLSPGHRLNLSTDSSVREQELRREFGKDEAGEIDAALSQLIALDESADSFLAAMPALPPDGFRERRATKKAASSLDLDRPIPMPPPSHPVSAAIHALSRLSTYLWTENPAPLHLLRSSARLLHGIHRAEDADHTGGYARMLRNRLRELGGEAVGGGNAVAEEIEVEKGRISGVRVVGDSSEYRCRFLVAGIETAALRRLIPLSGRRKRYDSTLDSVRPREGLFTVNLVLRLEGWPVGLGEVAVYVVDPAAPLQEENLLLLQRFDAIADDGGTEHDKVVLQISCFISSARRDLGEAYLEELQNRLVDALRADLMPFLDRHLVAISCPYLARHGHGRGARLSPHPLLETDLTPAYGVAVLPPRTPYKNLVLVGREVVPGLGLEGEFLAGRQGAQIVAAASNKHDPLRHQ